MRLKYQTKPNREFSVVLHLLIQVVCLTVKHETFLFYFIFSKCSETWWICSQVCDGPLQSARLPCSQLVKLTNTTHLHAVVKQPPRIKTTEMSRICSRRSQSASWITLSYDHFLFPGCITSRARSSFLCREDLSCAAVWTMFRSSGRLLYPLCVKLWLFFLFLWTHWLTKSQPWKFVLN